MLHFPADTIKKKDEPLMTRPFLCPGSLVEGLEVKSKSKLDLPVRA
jgi:hypothetical protein